MTTAAWPTTLPSCPILSSFEETPQSSVTSFKPEVGPPKMRRRSTAKTWITQVAHRMSNTQVTAFKTFYETTLEDGSLPFTWNHPITLVNYSWNFNPGNEPTITRMAPNRHIVAFTLLRLP